MRGCDCGSDRATSPIPAIMQDGETSEIWSFQLLAITAAVHRCAVYGNVKACLGLASRCSDAWIAGGRGYWSILHNMVDDSL